MEVLKFVLMVAVVTTALYALTVGTVVMASISYYVLSEVHSGLGIAAATCTLVTPILLFKLFLNKRS